eukprot:PhF_6_TR37953/c0_g1_i1/m.56718
MKVFHGEQINVLLNGYLTLSISDYPYVFGVEYQVTITVMMTMLEDTPVSSQIFQLERCPQASDTSDNLPAAVRGTSYCAPCPENGVCNGTIIVLAKENMYRPLPIYAAFIPCDES